MFGKKDPPEKVWYVKKYYKWPVWVFLNSTYDIFESLSKNLNFLATLHLSNSYFIPAINQFVGNCEFNRKKTF